MVEGFLNAVVALLGKRKAQVKHGLDASKINMNVPLSYHNIWAMIWYLYLTPSQVQNTTHNPHTNHNWYSTFFARALATFFQLQVKSVSIDHDFLTLIAQSFRRVASRVQVSDQHPSCFSFGPLCL